MTPRIPAPGEAPRVLWKDMPKNCDLVGLAPIGVPWRAKRINGKITPEGNCPPGEFAVTHAWVDSMWKEVV